MAFLKKESRIFKFKNFYILYTRLFFVFFRYICFKIFLQGAKMQGKILADGLIGGNDGNRYTYTASDLKNAQGKSINAIIGSEVDFESKDGRASEIYITKETKTLGKDRLKSTLQSVDSALSNFYTNKAKSKIKSAFGGADTGLARIQKRTYAMVACFVASSVLPFGFVFKVVAFVFGILATKELCKLTQSVDEKNLSHFLCWYG